MLACFALSAPSPHCGWRAKVIFLRLAELTQGETDMRIASGDWSGYNTLNYSLVEYRAHARQLLLT